VDDAHGEGVLGRGGRGIVDHYGLHGKVDVELARSRRPSGVVGGLVAGRQVIIDWLRQRARPFLFSSAMTRSRRGCLPGGDRVLEESDELTRRPVGE